ncbi:MAG: AAA family ATPase [Clostridia bacterium]|nr:AAA family ATPase [Clostridia bacterium]
MKKYGLLGRRLLHSLSPEIHRELGNFSYELFQVEPEDLEAFITKKDFAGLSIVFPYKKEVVKYCDILTDTARKLDCVDTITVDEEGRLIGDNCEYDGFRHMITKCGIDVKGKKVLLLGKNASVIRCAIEDMGAREIVDVTVDGKVNFENIYEHEDAEVLVNTTQTGMYPNNGDKIVDVKRFPKIGGVLEVIYNPRRTKLICDAEDLEIPNSDGLSMLVAREYMAEIRFGRIEPDEELFKATYKTMSDRRKNIIFVGLPGCGKTTIAKVVAAKLGRPCIDVDRLIEMKAGIPVSAIFTAYGEKYYRELETETLRKITRNGGQVISTDSGAVMSLENQYYLRQNGYIVWLSRDLSDLKLNGVYLARNREALERIHAERSPIYKFLADINVEVTDNAEKTVFEIIKKMNIKQNPSVY